MTYETSALSLPDGGPAGRLGHADSLALLTRQSEILGLLASGAPLSQVLTAVVTALEDLMPDSRCSVLLLDSESGSLRHGAAPSLAPEYCQAIDGLAIGPQAGSCGTAAYLSEPVVSFDIATDERWTAFRRFALPHGLRACWSNPIFGTDGSVLGTFAVYHPEPHSPGERERALVARVRHLAAVAIDHDRLFGALAESEERFRRAFEDNAVGMALLDMQGRYLRVNDALCTMVGRPAAELLDSGFIDITHPDDKAASMRAWTALTSGETPSTTVEKRYVRPDGGEVVVAMTASVVRGADGRPRYVSSNVMDITGRRAAEEARVARREAEAAGAAAERASQAKSDFLSAMSHELRTPLSAITGFAELLQTLDCDEDRQRTGLRHISQAAEHISAIVDDVLDTARIEAGAVRIDRQTLTFAPLVREVLDLVEPLAGHRGIQLVADRLDGTAAAVADPLRLRQVLLNILSNAIKYSHPGDRVDVEVGRGAGRAVITVRDTGPGIPRDAQDRLFTPFDRLGAEDSGEPGAGLGLVLSRRLVDAMGGALTVVSPPGSGTTAEVAFDLDEP